MDAEQKSEQQIVKDLVYLCGCAVNGSVPDTGRIARMDLVSLYRTAEQHMLTAAVAYALETAGIRDHAFTQARALAIRKMVIMDSETEKVLERLEAAGIWYMPLKGAVLKELYPAYGIRQMSDRDILIDASKDRDVRQVMEGLGYETESFGKEHHDCYVKPPFCVFEMHRYLFEAMQGQLFTEYYTDVKSRLLKDKDNKFGWQFSPEDFYIHMIAHEYKHYAGSGTGLRSLLDTYVYLKNVKLDFNYVAAETEKLGIAEFEKANRELVLNLYGERALSEAEQKILKRVVESGTYGTLEGFIEKQLAEKGRKGYFLSRLTLPYPVMQEHYPVLRKLPVLYPFCWMHRLVHGFFFKNHKFMEQVRAWLTWKDTDLKF